MSCTNEERVVHKIGGSLMIALPTEFTEKQHLKSGNKVHIQFHDEIIIITPVETEMTRTGAKFDFIQGITVRLENGPKPNNSLPIDNENVD
jgi:antitoxin component of MazEF toxin-antitoxin module